MLPSKRKNQLNGKHFLLIKKWKCTKCHMFVSINSFLICPGRFVNLVMEYCLGNLVHLIRMDGSRDYLHNCYALQTLGKQLKYKPKYQLDFSYWVNSILFAHERHFCCNATHFALQFSLFCVVVVFMLWSTNRIGAVLI